MLSNFEHLTAADLQQHGTALRSLGRSLLGRDDADDLVQEGWLAALQARGPRHLGGWLVGTVRRLAASRRRAEVRRRRREQVVAAPESVPAVVDTVAQAEVLQRVAAEVVSLSEPYRTAVVLRFWHGLSPRQLSAHLTVPVDTARSRVQRGVALLRARLSRDFGNAWVAPLTAVIDSAEKGLPGAIGAVSPSASRWLSPSLLVTKTKALGLAAGVILAAAVLFVWYSADSTLARPTAHTNATGSVTGDAAVADSSTQPIDVVERAAVGIPDQATEDRGAEATLVVRLCAAGTGVPLAGYGVRLRRAESPNRQQRASTSTSTFAPTDARGAVVFAGLEPTSWWIEVDRLSGVLQEVEAGKVNERLVEVPLGVTVTGTVVDAQGQPAPGAAVVQHGSCIGARPTIATSDALGRFRAEHILAGVELLAMKKGKVPSLAQLVVGEAGSTMDLQLRLGCDGCRLDGRAVDASGAPLVGAIVAVLPAAARQVAPHDRSKPQVRALWLRTDASGRFSSTEVDVGCQVVFVQPENPSVAPCWAEADTTAGDAFVELRSVPGGMVVGMVRQRGEPVAGVRVSARPMHTALDVGYLLNLIGLWTTTDADGSYRLDGLAPGDHILSVSRGVEQLGRKTIALAAGSSATWDLTLGDAPLRLRLQPATVATQERVCAVVRKSAADGGVSIVPFGVPFGPDGMALLHGPRRWPVDVVVAIERSASEYLELAIRTGVPSSTTEMTIELQPQDLPVRNVQGRLVGVNGAPVVRATVGVRREGDKGLAVRCAAVTRSDGGFTVGPLPVGDYTVSVGEGAESRVVARVLITALRDEVLGDVVDLGR